MLGLTTEITIFVDEGLPHEMVARIIGDKLHQFIVASDAICCEVRGGYETRVGKLQSIHHALQEIRKVRAGEKSVIAERVKTEGKKL